ncbi:MAG: class II fumarate hydratase [Planctomycetes bacterium]|nr:class II fumarate hydratase [Planctomycetota bacterium]
METTETRVERDSLGEVRVPAGALWGAQTQRAVENFPVSGWRLPAPFLRALARIKAAAARANAELGQQPADLAEAIALAAEEVADGGHAEQFPVDVFQTGSGTSSNMNMNEVLATLASRRLGRPVHPNDDVNRGQSSNDVVPSAIHVAAAVELEERLQPALAQLEAAIDARARELADVVKTGRTHLMDAVPLTFGQELGAWRTQVRQARERLASTRPRLLALALGGTAVGTGLNAHPELGARACAHLERATGLPFRPADDRFERIATQDTAVELSGQLRALAVALTKISNDLRWSNSGPLAGLGELRLRALQPGSSIMPGKVNPVVPEAVLMVSAQVIGHDATITVAGQAGSFQLNTMLPLVAHALLESLRLLAGGARLLAERAIAGFTVDRERVAAALERNPILVTALNPRIGYEAAAAVAKAAYAEGRPVREVAAERTGLPPDELARLLDPRRLAGGGLVG